MKADEGNAMTEKKSNLTVVGEIGKPPSAVAAAPIASRAEVSLLRMGHELAHLQRLREAFSGTEESREAEIFAPLSDLKERILATPADSLAGLAVQARAFLDSHEAEYPPGSPWKEPPLEFSRLGYVLAQGILRLAADVGGTIMSADIIGRRPPA